MLPRIIKSLAQRKILKTNCPTNLKRLVCRNTHNGRHGFLRNFSQRNINQKSPSRCYTRMPKTPDLIYIPHIVRWLKTKFQFKYLQRTMDPDFTEGAFIYGTTKAVCRITEIIHESNPEELRGLLTDTARLKLLEDMKTKLNKTQKSIIKINPEDIKILVPMTVCLNNKEGNKNCTIGMRVLALKWIQQNSGGLRLVLVALQTEFLKNYNDGATPDWTISAFNILECVILTQSPGIN